MFWPVDHHQAIFTKRTVKVHVLQISHGTETKKYLHLPSEFQRKRQKLQKSWIYIMCNNL